METRNSQERFNQDIEQILAGQEPSGSQAADPEYRQVLSVAQRLSALDLSAHSRQRLLLRQRLLNQARGMPRPVGVPQARSRAGWSWALNMGLLLVLVLGLVWGIARLLPRPAALPAAGGNQTPAAPLLTAGSSPQDVIALALSPTWVSLWLDGYVRETGPNGELQTTVFQVWLDHNGLGRVVSSDLLSLAPEGLSNLSGLAPRFVSLSDGQRMLRFDTVTNQFLPGYETMGFARHPLENDGDYMQIIFPYFLNSGQGVYLVEGERQIAGRTAVILAWKADTSSPLTYRFFVDSFNGVLLSSQAFSPNGADLLREVRVIALDDQSVFPPALATMQNLLPAVFYPAPLTPDQVPPAEFILLPTPQPQPQPTPFPLPVSNQVLLQLGAAAQDIISASGEVYFVLNDYSSGLRSVLRVSADCLTQQDACPAQLLPGLPAPAGSPLYWSPDGSQALIIDSNSARLLRLLDPVSGAWQVLAENFQPSIELALWSPDGLWIAVVRQAGNGDDLINLIAVDGSTVLPSAADLGGTQIPLGWQDANTLVFMRLRTAGKGLAAGGDEPPRLYRLSLIDGTWSELPVAASWSLIKSYPALSPDGQMLALAEETGLSLFDLTTNTSTFLNQSLSLAQWSPDGQWLAGVWLEEGNRVILGALRRDGSDLHRLFEWDAMPYFTWTADSAYLLVEGGPTPQMAGAEQYLVSLATGAIRTILPAGPAGPYELRYPSASRR